MISPASSGRNGWTFDRPRSSQVTGPRMTGLPWRSNHGLFSTRPATGATLPARRRRSSHSGVISPPVECAITMTGRSGCSSVMTSSAVSSSASYVARSDTKCAVWPGFRARPDLRRSSA